MKKTLLILGMMGLLVGIVMYPWGEPSAPATPGATTEWTSYWWVLLVGVLMATGIYLVWHHAKSYPKIATAAAFVLVCWGLVYGLYPEMREQMVQPLAIGALLIAIVGYCFIVIIKEVFWKDSWFTAMIMILVLVAILEPAVTRNLPAEVKDRLSGLLRHHDSTSVAINATHCAGVYQRMPLTTTAQPLPDCNFNYLVESGEVKFTRQDKVTKRTLPPQVVRAGQIVGLDESAYYLAWEATNGSAIVDVAFCRRPTRWDGRGCS